MLIRSSVLQSLFVLRKNEKSDLDVKRGRVAIRTHTIVAIIEEDVILRKMIGSVQPATTSTSLGELNATVVEKPRMGTSRRTNPQDGRTIVQISDVSDLVKNVMDKTTGNVLLATTTTSRSERNATDVENRSQVVEAMIVHVVGAIPTGVEDSVEAEMEAEVSVEIEEAVILIVVVETGTVGETSEEIEEVVILIVVVEVEAAVMSDAIQEEVVRAVIVTMIVQMSAIEKQEGNVLVMRITEDRSQFVHVAIKAKIEMIEVNT